MKPAERLNMDRTKYSKAQRGEEPCGAKRPIRAERAKHEASGALKK